MLVFFSLWVSRTHAQTSGTVAKNYHHYLRGGYQAGYVLKTNDFIKGKNLKNEPIDWYHSLRLEFGWETTGAQMWHQIWKYPAFGFGVYALDYFGEEQLGNPLAAYGFAVWPLVRKEKFTFNLNFGFGMSFNWKPFDPATNPYNVAIGNFESAYIDVGVTLDYELSKRLNLVGAFTGTHFSNGGTRQPNWGINQAGLLVMLKYKMEETKPAFTKWEIPAYQKNYEWLISGSWGIRNVLFDVDIPELSNAYLRRDFAVWTLTSTFYRQLSYKSKVGAGVDLVFDRSINAQIDAADGKIDNIDLPSQDEIRVGLYGAYEFVLYRLSVLINVGYSVIQKENQLPDLYQRLGAKYHFFDDFFAGLNVRFQDFSKATHLEWNLGYRVRW
jgi:hypothetical protein